LASAEIRKILTLPSIGINPATADYVGSGAVAGDVFKIGKTRIENPVQEIYLVGEAITAYWILSFISPTK